MAKKLIGSPLDILTPKDEVPEETKPTESQAINIEYGEPTDMSQRLEDAANLLLSQLVPSTSDFFCEVADLVLKIRRWQLMLGSVLAQFESGSLPAPSLDPGWVRGEIAETKRVCEQCHKEFEPKRFGQRFCSNVCGAKAAKEKTHVSTELRA